MGTAPDPNAQTTSHGALVGSACRGLEKLDHIAGWIFEQDLLPAGPSHEVVADCRPGVGQPGDLSVYAVDDEVDPIPPSGTGCAAVGHGTPCRALRSGEERPQVSALDVR